MKPFRPFTKLRFAPALFRWPVWHTAEIPIERPPRSRRPRGRVHVVWSGDAAPPFLQEVEEPPKADGFRLQPWF